MGRATGYVLILAALAGMACHTMKPVTLEQLAVLKPDRAWVTAADQSVVVVAGPQMVGDTLVGYVRGEYQELPAANLKQVLVSRPSPRRTALLIAGIAVGFSGFAYLITGAIGGDKYLGSDYCEEHPEDPDCQAL